jgi:DnaJ-class molecular chaperone
VSLAPLEIRALAKIVGELDYYQILEIERGASRAEIKQAYYKNSRSYHPDANRGLQPEQLLECELITKRVTEAYCVLRDPRRRGAYDERIGSGGDVRMQLAEATAEHKRTRREERQGKTPQGRQFFQLAQQEADRGNLKAAIQNLQMALTFEPGNAGFESLLADWKARPQS